jgi:hypothetical protein
MGKDDNRFRRQGLPGETEGNGLLSDFMAHGALIPGRIPRVPGAKRPRIMGIDEMKVLAEHALFMYIIPEAWRHNKDPTSPSSVRAAPAATLATAAPRNIRSDDARKVELCFDNKQYLILGAIGKERCCDYPPGGDRPTCWNCPWSTPPGLEGLKDFGLTYHDIMAA